MLKRRLIRSVEKLEALKVAYRKNARPLDIPNTPCIPPSVSAAGVSGQACVHPWRQIPIRVYEEDHQKFLQRNPVYALRLQWEADDAGEL